MRSSLAEQSIRLERWYRGYREFRRLRRADAVVVSYGKAGRTWLRAMLSRYCQLRFGIADDLLLEFDNFHRRNASAPRLLFTHDNYLRGYTGNLRSKRDFYPYPTLLLARCPRDVAVSQFFQWRHRMRARKKLINRYPAHGADISIWEFVNDERQGLPRIIRFMNGWAEDIHNMPRFAMVRYEDLRADPHSEMRRIVEFFRLAPRREWLEDCVAFASPERLRDMEASGHFRNRGRRLRAGDPDEPDSFKVRRAKVGGYRDYFGEERLALLDAMVRERLHPVFGYASVA